MTTPPTGIVVVPGTDYWVVEGDTHLGAWAKQKGDIVTDPHLFKFLGLYMADVKNVWSIGANIGDHALHYIRTGKRVVAVEPHPVTFRCLQHNVPDALCLNLAASHEAGSLNFASCENVGASRVHKDGEWSVPAVAMDDIPNLLAPDFIEIDIEGWEPNAITGMAGTITRHKPILFLEANRGALEANGFTVEGLIEQVRSLGYREPILYPERAKLDWPQFDMLFLPQP